MKNIIISILATKIIMDLPIWELDGSDWIYVSVAIAIILFVNISVIEDSWYKARRKANMQRRRADRFKREIADLTKKEAM